MAYAQFMAYRVADPYELESFFTDQQDFFLPINPPYADFTLNQPGFPSAIPFDPSSFPPDFTNNLLPRLENSVPVYGVWIEEDPVTRDTVFRNEQDQVIYRIPPPPGYDPYVYIKALKPDLYSGRYPSLQLQSLLAIFDPARIRIHVTLVPEKHVEPYLFVADVLARQTPESSPMLLMGEGSGDFAFVAMKPTNSIAFTIALPDMTNDIDIFTGNDLSAAWSFAARDLPHPGTNILHWIDSNDWLEVGYPVRYYAAGDAGSDADGDGFADAREVMVYQTDPTNASSRPYTVSGAVDYPGPETGPVQVVFVPAPESWSTAKSTLLPAPGGYTNHEIGNAQATWIKAFVDVSGNFQRDDWEPQGVHPAGLTVTGDMTGVDVAMADVPSVWGVINYTGTATGDIHVVAVTLSNAWNTTHQAVIPYVQGVGTTGQPLYVQFPLNYAIIGLPPTSYWIRAFMDTDGAGTASGFDPSGWPTNSEIPVVHRVTGVDLTLHADADADGLPDWWELEHFGGITGGLADEDSDLDGLTNQVEYENGTNPHDSDTDGDGFIDGHELAEATDPLDDTDAPALYMIINDDAEYANSTNLAIRFPGYLADSATISEQATLSNGVTMPVTASMPFALQGVSNGIRDIYAVLFRNNTTSSLVQGTIVFDNVPPQLGGISFTNNETTSRRWIKLTGSVFDEQSPTRVFVNNQWVHGNTSTSFWHDRIMLGAGSNTMVVVAQDLAGNTATQSLCIEQDVASDIVAPALSVSLPGQTTNDAPLIYGDNPTMYFKGCTDDETAEVLVYAVADSITNGPWAAVVSGTQVWFRVDLEAGTNSLILIAKDAAVNSTVVSRVVVRDTNFIFTITAPASYQVMNAASVIVTGVASPMFQNATITVNGVSTTISNVGNLVEFATISGVPLSVGRTELVGKAVLNGVEYYTDPPPVGYELLKFAIKGTSRHDRLSIDGCYISDTSLISSFRNDWDCMGKTMMFQDAYQSYRDCLYYTCPEPYSYCSPVSDPVSSSQYTEYPEYSASWMTFRADIFGTDQYYDRAQWDMASDTTLHYMKHWQTQELQTVILQFPDMRVGGAWDIIPELVEDPSSITYRGQTGFWYNGNVSFVVPVETEVEYTISGSDFSWPTFRRSSWGYWRGRMSSKYMMFSTGISNDILKVDTVQYKLNGVWTDVPASFSGIGKDTSITFRALPSPSGASWPAGYPQWGGDASGSGDEKQVTFSSSGNRTVSVTCGNTISIPVAVDVANTAITITWDAAGYQSDNNNGASTCVERNHTVTYIASADIDANEWLKWSPSFGQGRRFDCI